jgi:hypothetical protein
VHFLANYDISSSIFEETVESYDVCIVSGFQFQTPSIYQKKQKTVKSVLAALDHIVEFVVLFLLLFVWHRQISLIVHLCVHQTVVETLGRHLPNSYQDFTRILLPVSTTRLFSTKGPFPLAFFARVSPSAMAPPPNCSLCFSRALTKKQRKQLGGAPSQTEKREQKTRVETAP